MKDSLRSLRDDALATYSQGLRPIRGEFKVTRENGIECCLLTAAYLHRNSPNSIPDSWGNWKDNDTVEKTVQSYAANKYGLSLGQCSAIIQGFDQSGNILEVVEDEVEAYQFGEQVGIELLGAKYAPA